MKKAIFIINSLQNGGAERVVVTQAEYLQKKGMDVTVICLRNWFQYDIHSSVKIICLSRQRSFSLFTYITGLFSITRRLNHELDKLTRSGEVELISSNLLYPNLITRLSQYSKQAVYVLHAHQNILKFSKNLFYKVFIRWLYGQRRLICVGETVEEEMCKVYHIDKKMIRTVVNPVNKKSIDRLQKEPVRYKGPFILFCGRLTELKHPERMLKAFYQGKFYEKYSLVILGVGELESDLRNMVQTYGIEDNVYFGGWEKNVYKWMNKASLLVLTSDTEGLSMVLIEALYCECPVVAVDSRGPSQILTGELQKYLCDTSIDSIVNTMREALKDYPDGLKEYTKNYSIDRNLQKYIEIYKDWNESLR